MEELNKRLAEWAGISPNTSYGYPSTWLFMFPNGDHGVLPDFPHDLNACMKWLVPKAISEFGIQKICSALSNALFHAYMSNTNDTADRFCKAIEKLVLREKEGS